MRRLKGKRIVVAGGATGIGAATVERLVKEGASVVVGDINIASLVADLLLWSLCVAGLVTSMGGAGAVFNGTQETVAVLIAMAMVSLGAAGGLAQNYRQTTPTGRRPGSDVS